MVEIFGDEFLDTLINFELLNKPDKLKGTVDQNNLEEVIAGIFNMKTDLVETRKDKFANQKRGTLLAFNKKQKQRNMAIQEAKINNIRI